MSDAGLHFERRGPIAIVFIDAPPHNPMSLDLGGSVLAAQRGTRSTSGCGPI